MAKLPLVALIGKPNTGKSTLFNRLVGHRKSIIAEVPGTTRDHVTHTIETPTVDYLLVDTGGVGGGSSDTALEDDVELQSMLAVRHADVVVFVVDGRTELSASDYAVAEILRREKKRHVPVILALNKCDPPVPPDIAHPFYALGVTAEILPVSALHRYGIARLEESITAHLQRLHFGKSSGPSPAAGVPKIAIVGRPNTGKSSLVNALMSDAQRAVSPHLVDEEPGTTRDTTDTVVRHEGMEYVFLDTAGLRRQSRLERGVESFSVMRALQAMQEADVTIIVLDATCPVVRQDKAIAGFATARGTGLIVLINKIDLIGSEKRQQVLSHARWSLAFCHWAPFLMVSALTRENLLKIFPLVGNVLVNRRRKIPFDECRRFYDAVADKGELLLGRRGAMRIEGIEQERVSPPRFVIRVSDPARLSDRALKFFERRLRENFAFEGTPISWVKRTS
jgi:GTP-binding protein